MLENEPFNEDEGGFNREPRQSPPPLDKNQKMAAAGLAVFAVLIVVLWMAQLRSNIYEPFNSSSGQSQVASEEQNRDEALKTKDTDNDGLSDYDELNMYKTSPYLEDTDGDTLKDGEEIKNNTDPNCPKGETCSGGLLDNSATADQSGGASAAPNDTLNSLLNQFGATEPQTQSTLNTENLTSDQLDALKNIDAASLRELLIQAGMDKGALDKISDTDLMKSYGETFSSGQ
ncbi:MAG: hypothetical protein PHF50_04440 [Patescibacteria group bacterium]|nr:hypothetical protein [Patescibacteria group bacterium]